MKRRLLVADACFSQSERIEQFFTRRGYETDVAHDGLDCLAKIQHFAPDAVILDWDLPWGGGAGVLACMRELRSCANIPVILVTDYFSSELDTHEPVVRCLQRPFDIESLKETIDMLTNSAKPPRETVIATGGHFKFQPACR